MRNKDDNTESGNLNIPLYVRHNSRARRVAEWLGSLLGILGASMLAVNAPWSGYGWWAFLASNLAWMVYAILGSVRSILLMQIVFMATSVLGIVRWLA